MKRALAMALGAMMVAGSAAPASAASHIDFSGYYRINYIVDNNRNYTNEKDSFTDHYFDDRLQVNLTFRPTDEIAVHWAFRGPNRDRWGATAAGTNMATRHVYGEVVQDWGTVVVGRLSDDFDAYGLGSLGYMPGFGPYVNVSPFDDGAVIDAIRYTKRWDNGFGIMGQYAKTDSGLGNTDANGNFGNFAHTTPDGTRGHSDYDRDRYTMEGSYLWDGGGASVAFTYDRDATSGQSFGVSAPTLRAANDWYNPGDGFAYDKLTAFYVNPAIMHTWDNGLGIHFEGMFGWGEYERVAGWVRGNKPFKDVDADGYGLYLDVDYNYGPGNVNLAGWWLSGSDLGDTEHSGLVNMGDNFYPLLVAYGHVGNNATRTDSRIRNTDNAYSGYSAIGFANNAYENYIMPGFINGIATGASPDRGFLNGAAGFTPNTPAGVTDFLNSHSIAANKGGIVGGQRNLFDNGEANHWAIALTGNHAFTDDITMHYGVAYLSLVNPNYKVASKGDFGISNAGYTITGYHEQDKDLGFEMDLGFRFQLLDNLSFNTSFGYMIAGDAYKQLRGYSYSSLTDDTFNSLTGNVKAKWEDGDDSYVWYNTLQFDF